jgi:hypothetical protein
MCDFHFYFKLLFCCGDKIGLLVTPLLYFSWGFCLRSEGQTCLCKSLLRLLLGHMALANSCSHHCVWQSLVSMVSSLALSQPAFGPFWAIRWLHICCHATLVTSTSARLCWALLFWTCSHLLQGSTWGMRQRSPLFSDFTDLERKTYIFPFHPHQQLRTSFSLASYEDSISY